MSGRNRFVAVLIALMLAGIAAGTASAENYGGMSRRYEQRVERIVHAWFKGNTGRAICVIRHESGYNPWAVNYAGPVAGLFQMKWPLWAVNNPDVRAQPARYGWVIRFWHGRQVSFAQFRARLADPVQATRFAFLLYRHSGMGPWSYDGC